MREIIAFMLDQKNGGIAKVQPTGLVESWHASFNNEDSEYVVPAHQHHHNQQQQRKRGMGCKIEEGGGGEDERKEEKGKKAFDGKKERAGENGKRGSEGQGELKEDKRDINVSSIASKMSENAADTNACPPVTFQHTAASNTSTSAREGASILAGDPPSTSLNTSN